MQGGTKTALRQEGHVSQRRLDALKNNMALLAEGGRVTSRFYKHRPPGGGRARHVTVSINMGPPGGGRRQI